ncbi:hypothetical protein D9M69_728020 [compost metagenome]
MFERDVGGFAGCHAEADAHNLRHHFVERSGFGVHGHELGGFQPGEPGVEGFPGEDGVVLEGAGAGGCFAGLGGFGFAEEVVGGRAPHPGPLPRGARE